MLQKRILLTWLPAILWAATIFLLSAQSALPPVGPQFRNVDKLNHLAAYALLAGLVMLPLRRSHKLPLPNTLMLAILVASVYGITDEFHQAFVPNRTCDVWDWVADTLGAVVAAGLMIVYETFRSRKTNR